MGSNTRPAREQSYQQQKAGYRTERPTYIRQEALVAYDEKLAARVQEALGELPGLVGKKMFGGIGYMVLGNMACGVHGNNLIVRVGPARYQEALAEPHTSPFDLTGRAMKGWVYVDPAGCQSADDLQRWVQQGVDFALSLPQKT